MLKEEISNMFDNCIWTVFFSAERHECDLVTRLLEMNEKARKTEELLEQMEKER
jgi:hypothetical protein